MWKHLLGIGASLTMLSAATADKGWRLHGGTQTDQRFSSLNQINGEVSRSVRDARQPALLSSVRCQGASDIEPQDHTTDP